MNKKFRELLNSVGLIVAAFVLIAVAIAFIFFVSAIFHTNFK